MIDDKLVTMQACPNIVKHRSKDLGVWGVGVSGFEFRLLGCRVMSHGFESSKH